ncbi:MAG: hypothetical protein [Caudoviricetes sp.]|nr:MAG: hypothetical protein [Caudoviricetes sp.]
MSIDLAVVIDTTRLTRAFAKLGALGTAGKDIMRVAASALLSSTEYAFENEVDPVSNHHWADWSDPYLAWREKHDHTPGSILTLNGDLARSITTDYGPSWALIGSPKVCAAIHQWGGKAGMAPGPAGIPERSYMGLDDVGETEIFNYIKKRAKMALAG